MPTGEVWTILIDSSTVINMIVQIASTTELHSPVIRDITVTSDLPQQVDALSCGANFASLVNTLGRQIAAR